MTLLWGLMCIFVACGPSTQEPQGPNLIVTVSPVTASISVGGGMGVTTLSEEAAELSAAPAHSASFYAEPGAHYTVRVEADGHAAFARRIWVPDDRRVQLAVELAPGGSESGGYTQAFEAEAATAGSNLDVQDDDSASGGAYLAQPSSAQNTEDAAEDAFVTLEVPTTGSYTLWARMRADSDEGDAMYLGFNGSLERAFPETKGEYVWVRAANARLEASGNKISIGHGEAGARLDLLVVTSDDLADQHLGAYITKVAVVETPMAPSSLATSSESSSQVQPPDQDVYALRGDPSFSTEQLSAEQLKWYEAMWKVINNPDQYPNAAEMASSDDIYKYRGDLQNYVLSLMLAFRLIGDLRMLDEVSELAEAMRAELADSWRGTKDGTDGTRDGFLNWVNRYDSNEKFRGKDTQMAYELKAHALVAMIGWALQNNRDLRSPAGYNYGSQADFWKDYLVKHFEAKWRERNDRPSGFPFAEYGGFHTLHSFMRYHYYMGKLTGNSAYTREAERMSESFWGGRFRTTDSKYGTALVWSNNTNDSYLHTQTYARYVVQEAIDLHFEGFGEYADDETLVGMARATSDFIIYDDSFERFARDIGGGVSRAGIPASPTTWDRMSQPRFAESGWSFLGHWDEDSDYRIIAAADKVYDEVEMVSQGSDPKRIFIPTAMFMLEWLN